MGEFDGTTHFDALVKSPNLHAAFALRSQAEINQHTHGQGQLLDHGGNNPQIRFDAAENAARVVVHPNRSGIPIAWQLRCEFPRIDKTSGDDEVSIQWEARWESSYLYVSDYGLNTHKEFTIASRGGKRYSIKSRFSRTDRTAVALPAIGTPTASETGGDGSIDPLRRTDEGYTDWQPGGDTTARYNHNDGRYNVSDHMGGGEQSNAFLIRADIWIRFTVSITFTGGVQWLRFWMSDEDTAPALVIANPVNSSFGFLTDFLTDDSGADEFRFEFGSSQEYTTNPELHAWIRNLVVFRNETVPLTTGVTMEPVTQTSIISIEAAPLAIISEPPARGRVGHPYNHPYLAAGGTPPYSWKLLEAPPGLLLVGATLSGTPTQPGNFPHTVELRDAS